jgi:hypothetical protein
VKLISLVVFTQQDAKNKNKNNRKEGISLVSETFLKHDPAGIKACRKTTKVIEKIISNIIRIVIILYIYNNIPIFPHIFETVSLTLMYSRIEKGISSKKLSQENDDLNTHSCHVIILTHSWS